MPFQCESFSLSIDLNEGSRQKGFQITDMCPLPHYRTFLDASIKQITNESFLYLRLREGLYLKSAILLITLQM